jgi:hypothetical protein
LIMMPLAFWDPTVTASASHDDDVFMLFRVSESFPRPSNLKSQFAVLFSGS